MTLKKIDITGTWLDRSMVKRFGPNWKSTLDGFMSFVAINSSLATVYLVNEAQAHPFRGWFWPSVTTTFGILSAFAKWYIGHITIDAGTTPAVLPDGKVIDAPSHEVPDDPAAKPIVNKQSGV